MESMIKCILFIHIIIKTVIFYTYWWTFFDQESLLDESIVPCWRFDVQTLGWAMLWGATRAVGNGFQRSFALIKLFVHNYFAGSTFQRFEIFLIFVASWTNHRIGSYKCVILVISEAVISSHGASYLFLYAGSRDACQQRLPHICDLHHVFSWGWSFLWSQPKLHRTTHFWIQF